MKTYLVGGAVRDKLLGLPVREKDWVVVGETPESMLEQGYKKIGKDFPIFLHPETHEEYALARTERKTGKGYYGFECYAAPDVTLEQDLARRDLTVNAIAEDKEGSLIDPYKGQDDLQSRVLRHVSNAFIEDPVRVLRVARFSAQLSDFDFTVAPETLNLMQSMVNSGEVDALVPERVWQELARALSQSDPSPFILVLRECGALKRLWPELDRLWGIPQPEQHHPEIDTGIHTMMVLKKASELSLQTQVRFAALCHDLGKGTTPKDQWPSHRGHEERGVKLIQDFCKRYRVPNDHRDLAIAVSRYHLHCHRAFELKPATLLSTLEHLNAFRQPERLEQFLLACEADALGRKGKEDGSYPQANWFRQAFEVARAVDVQPFIQEGLEGKALGERLHQQRVREISNLKPPSL